MYGSWATCRHCGTSWRRTRTSPSPGSCKWTADCHCKRSLAALNRCCFLPWLTLHPSGCRRFIPLKCWHTCINLVVVGCCMFQQLQQSEQTYLTVDAVWLRMQTCDTKACLEPMNCSVRRRAVPLLKAACSKYDVTHSVFSEQERSAAEQRATACGPRLVRNIATSANAPEEPGARGAVRREAFA